MGAMNRGLNLPQIQRIMHEFERESATMDMKEEMMSDAVDDVMDDDLEEEEEAGDKILRQVLDEIGVDLSQQVSIFPRRILPKLIDFGPPAHRRALRARCLLIAHGASSSSRSWGSIRSSAWVGKWTQQW